MTELTEPQRAWIAALRSGKYPQTREVLCRLNDAGEPVGYCCLGVACDLAVKANIIPPPRKDGDRFTYSDGRDDSYDSYLPPAVRDWLGLTRSYGTYRDGSLARLNDRGRPFAWIADVIEQRPAGLFVEEPS